MTTETTTIKLPPRHAQIHAMLCRAQGATVAEIAAELGLLHHSVRGMISTGRSKYGRDVLKDKNADGHTVYSLPGTAADTKPAKSARKARQAFKAAKPAAATRKTEAAKSRKAALKSVQADTAA
jgi:hypothetical protein